MYLLLIYFLILVVPIAVMPGYIRTGRMSPYRTVMQATLIVTVMTVIVFMVASMIWPRSWQIILWSRIR